MKYPIIAWEENSDTVTIHWSEYEWRQITISEAKQLWELLSGVFLPPNVIMRTISTPEEVEAWRTELRSNHHGYPLIVNEDPEPEGGITEPSFTENTVPYFDEASTLTEAEFMKALDTAFPDGDSGFTSKFIMGNDGIVYRSGQKVGVWGKSESGKITWGVTS